MNVYQKYKDAQGRKFGPWFMKYPIGRDPLTGKIKYKIEKVGDFKKLAERAYQKKMVDWAEKKYLDIKEESKLTFSQLVMWFLELPVVRQNKTIKHSNGPAETWKRSSDRYWSGRSNQPWWRSISTSGYGNQPGTVNPGRLPNINRTIAVLKRMFNLAVREELMEKNPCWKVKMLPREQCPRSHSVFGRI